MEEQTLRQPQGSTNALSVLGYRVLGKMALVGVEAGALDVVERMAQDMMKLRPDLPHASPILALVQVRRGLLLDALRTSQKCHEQFPEFQLGRVMVAMCTANTGGGGWQAELESVVEEGADEHAVDLACALLARENPYKQGAVRGNPDDSHSTPSGAQIWA